MNYTALSLEQTPPLRVPLRYFLTAPLFGVAAALVLLVAGPDVLAGRWTPATLALTHLLTLGFIAMVMMGAAQQLLPVLAGSPLVRPVAVSRTVHGLLTAGTIALVAGLWQGGGAWLHAAFILLVLLVLAFVGAAGLALFRAPTRHNTVRGMSLSVASLAVTGLLGLYLVAGHAHPAVPLARDLTDIHLAWGLVGWVALLVVGVAYQVVPMFQITPDYPARLARFLAPAVFAGLVVWSLGAFLGRHGNAFGPWLALPGSAVVAAGLLAFAGTTLWLQHRRRRRLPDVTLDFWRVGMGSLAAAVPLWVVMASDPGLAYSLAVPLGVLMLVGFAFSVINGMLYKIVPFLVWLHLNNRLQSVGAFQGRVPNMKQVIPAKRTRLQFWLHLASLPVLLLAALAPGWWLYPGAVLLLASNLMLWANLLSGAMLYRRTVNELRG